MFFDATRPVRTHEFVVFVLMASCFAAGCNGSFWDSLPVAMGGTSNASGDSDSQSGESDATVPDSSAVVLAGGAASRGTSRALLVNGGATTVLGTATGGDTTTKGGTSSSGRSSARGHTSSSGSTIAKSGTS